METKLLLTVLSFCIVAYSAESQNTATTESKGNQENSYMKALIIENTIYYLSCSEIAKYNDQHYYFELKKDDIIKTFYMDSINSNNENTTILTLKIISAIEKLGDKVEEEHKRIIETFSSKFLENACINLILKAYDEYVVGVLYLEKKALLYNADTFREPIGIVKIKSAEIKFEYEQIVGIKVVGTIDSLFAKGKIKDRRNNVANKVGAIDCLSKKGNLKNEPAAVEKKVSDTNDSLPNKEKITNTTKEVVFQNRIPIPYTTRKDVSFDYYKKKETQDTGTNSGFPGTWKKLLKHPKSDWRIYSRNRLFQTDTNSTLFIYFDDVIRNDYKFASQSENYSPANQIIRIDQNDNEKVIRKEPVTNLFSASIFTDLVGLKSLKPNGLIQFEISHRFYLSRKAFQINNSYSYYGFCNSIRPKIVFSKLETNNKVLDLEGESLPFTTYVINTFKYTSWSSGGEINLGFMGIPAIHSMFYINAGATFLNVPMKIPELDTPPEFHDINPDENNMFNKGFLTFYPEIYWVIHPHSRFLTNFSLRCNFLKNFSNDIKLVSDEDGVEDIFANDNFNKILSFRFAAALKLSNRTNSEIFFRSIYHFVCKDPSQSYFQAQLGYAFSIFDRKIVPPQVKPFEAF